MKTPISYYGGKQMMASKILPLIPPHKSYIEPFFGGGAIFWLKEPSDNEILNDINHKLISFYRVLRDDFDNLKALIDQTFHSRAQHTEADQVYESDVTDDLRLAWAVWVQTNMSFSSNIGSGFGYDKFGSCAKKIFNKKEQLTVAYKERLRKVTLECNDVLKVIKAYDHPDAFFYLDPPYVSSVQGHYRGYSEQDFRNLLEACGQLKGKFLLSSYPEPILQNYVDQFGWDSEYHVKTLAVDGRRTVKKQKIEVLTKNY